MSQCAREGLFFFLSDPEILTEEKSWRTWKSNQNIVMDEKLAQNTVGGCRIGSELRDG